MATARPRWHRVVIGTALNLGMTQIELAPLRRRHVIGLDTDAPAVEKCRDKTDVFCRWGFLFPEVAEGCGGSCPPTAANWCSSGPRGRRWS